MTAKRKPEPPPPEPTLAEKAQKIQIRNILKKLNDGKTITAREQQLLQDYEREQRKNTVSQSDLARKWQMSRQAVSKLVARGMPLTSVEDAEEWRERVLQFQFRGGSNETIQSAKLENLLLEGERRKIIIARMKREQVSYAVVKRLWTDCLLRIRSYIQQAKAITRDQAADISRGIMEEIANAEKELADAAFDAESEEPIEDAEEAEE